MTVEDPQYPSLESCRAVLSNLSVGDHSARANSSPVHVIFSHYLPGFLDPVLQSVLNWMVTHDAAGRDVEGRPSNRRRFSATQISGGYIVDGRRVSWGCGCNRGTVIRAMNTLEDYRIIRRIGDARSAKKGANGEYGCLYELELNYSAWDWEKMRARRKENDTSNRSRSEKARQALEEKRSANPSGAKTAPLKQSKRSVIQTNTGLVGLSGNPTAAIHSAPQSDPAFTISLSDNPIPERSVAQSDPQTIISLSGSPNHTDEIAPQSKTPVPLIKESLNKELRNVDGVQNLIDYYLWAFSRDDSWRSGGFQLTNGQVKEFSGWIGQHGEDQVRETIDTVSRLPNPPTLERAFGLVRYYLNKIGSAPVRRPGQPAKREAAASRYEPLVLDDAVPLDPDAAQVSLDPQVLEMLDRTRPADRDAMNMLRGELRRKLEKVDYSTWFEPTRLMGRDADGRIILGMLNSYGCEWANDRLKQTVERYLTGALAEATEVIFMVFTAQALSEGY